MKSSILMVLFLGIAHPLSTCFASTLFYARGEVKIDGKSASKGDPVSVGQVITTGVGALAIVDMEGGSKLKVEPQSKVKLKILNDEKKGSLVDLIAGNIIAKVRKLKVGKDRFQINAKKASFAVRGTLFFVGIDQTKKQDDIWMCVEEGEVAVRGESDKETTGVRAGEGVVVSKSLKTSKPTFFPWTKKINWEVNETKDIKDNDGVIEKAYANPLRRNYD